MDLTLAIIAKDEVEQVTEIIKDYSPYFKEIAIAADQRLDDFEKLTGKEGNCTISVYPYKWINDFADKRNFLASKVRTEYYFRLDTDDKILNVQSLERVFNKAKNQQIDVVYVEYLYSHDQDGNCNAKHWRETIIRKTPNAYWKCPVHENIFIEDMDTFKGVKETSFQIYHNITHEHALSSNRRNLEILIDDYNKNRENTDPRTIAYLGRSFLGIGEYEKAIPFLEILIAKSGWTEDKYYAWIQLADCYVRLKKYNEAIAACNEAIHLEEEYPDAYLKFGQIYLDQEKFEKALHWFNIGVSKKVPNTMNIIDPSVYGYLTQINMALCYFHIGDMEKANQLFQLAKKSVPNHEFVKKYESLFEQGLENNNYVKHLAWLVQYTKRNDPSKLVKLVEAIPTSMLKDERIHVLRHKTLPPKVWHKKEIAIYCGLGLEEWAPPSVHSGAGGSEEAVIYLSQELNRLGYSVTVFNSCGEMEGEYGGVKYKNYYEFNPNDLFNIVIAWRGNIFGGLNAKKKVIWLHDVPEGMFKKGDEETFDKVLVLSQYHKTLLPDFIPDEKICVSANGINLKDFVLKVEPERNPYRLIHTSSYDRGIENLLHMWSDIRKEVPQVELHLYYGWNTYDHLASLGMRDNKFKEYMVKLMDQPGVIDHGRVGHKKLNKEFYKSGIWVYPSHFEEISCISAMKAQACGCVPLVINYAALKETVKSGIRIDGKGGVGDANEKFKAELISLLKDTNKQEELRKEVLTHKSEFSWANVAKQWHEEIFS